MEGGGGTTLFASRVPPGTPAPPPVFPLPPPEPESCGGGEMMLGGPRDGAAAGDSERAPAVPEIPLEGGGAITFEPSDVPLPFRTPC